MGITRREYTDEINDLAADIVAEVEQHGGDVHDLTHEAVDGHQWVIYCGYNAEVVAASDSEPNDSGLFECCIEGKSWSEINTIAAFCVMEQDLGVALGEAVDERVSELDDERDDCETHLTTAEEDETVSEEDRDEWTEAIESRIGTLTDAIDNLS